MNNFKIINRISKNSSNIKIVVYLCFYKYVSLAISFWFSGKLL
jgi:hypothetical protein